MRDLSVTIETKHTRRPHVRFSFRCCVVSNRLTPAVTVLNPVEVNHAERGGGDAGGSVIIVLVDVQVEGRVAVHIVRPKARSQRLLNRLIAQPLFKLRGPTHIVDDALLAQTHPDFSIFSKGKA